MLIPRSMITLLNVEIQQYIRHLKSEATLLLLALLLASSIILSTYFSIFLDFSMNAFHYN